MKHHITLQKYGLHGLICVLHENDFVCLVQLIRIFRVKPVRHENDKKSKGRFVTRLGVEFTFAPLAVQYL